MVKCPKEGSRLMVSLFGLAPSLVPNLHEAVKRNLPGAPVKIAEAYGDVYLKARFMFEFGAASTTYFIKGQRTVQISS